MLEQPTPTPQPDHTAVDPYADLVAGLPAALKSFDAWRYPNGLHDYMAALARTLPAETRLAPVMSTAGLRAADWFRCARAGSARRPGAA